MRKAMVTLVAAAIWLGVIAPSPGQAQTVTFVEPTDINIPGGFTGGATPYPSTIIVGGLSGTVTRASVLLLGVDAGGNIEALDLVLVGPNGGKVMLWSDACGSLGPFDDLDYGFDDATGTFLSDPGPCAAGPYMPSNYENPALDNLSVGLNSAGGPTPPYTNSLSAFNGIPPNGNWNLFAYSDTNADFIEIGAWALFLTIQPPPPVTTPAPATETGQRAAALAKCKKKRGKAKRRCKRKARQLPL
jgi:hypothetical protein